MSTMKFKTSNTVISGISYYQTNVTNETHFYKIFQLNNIASDTIFNASAFLEEKDKALESLDNLHDNLDNEEDNTSLSFISDSSLL